MQKDKHRRQKQMPLLKGKSKKKANRQAVAIAMSVGKNGIRFRSSADRAISKLKRKIAKSMLPKL